MESAASIKRGGRRGPPRIPAPGSKLRAFYDSLHRAAEAGGFVPRMDGDDAVALSNYVNNLQLFYGMDIVTIKKVRYRRKLGEKGVVGWRLIGQHVGRDYYSFGSVPAAEHHRTPSDTAPKARRARSQGQPGASPNSRLGRCDGPTQN